MNREELIGICEDAVVPEAEWLDRDSYGAHRQVGECWALLRAGCDFAVHPRRNAPYDMNTTSKTIWLTIRSQGFKYHELHDPRDAHDYRDDETYYLPTRARLKRADGKDWYGA